MGEGYFSDYTSEPLLVVAATVLFCVLALLVLVVAAMVALGIMRWPYALVIVIAFIVIMYVACWSLKSYLVSLDGTRGGGKRTSNSATDCKEG